MIIRMVVEADITEDINTLYAHQTVAKRISLLLSEIDWVQRVKIINEL